MTICHRAMSQMFGGLFWAMEDFYIVMFLNYYSILVRTLDLVGEGYGGELKFGSGYNCHG